MSHRRAQATYARPSNGLPDRFDLLVAASDPPRVAILAALSGAGELPIEELSARARARNERPRLGLEPAGDGALSPANLRHRHLPKLAEVDLVEVDDGETISVRPGPAFDVDAIEEIVRSVEAGTIDDEAIAALEKPRRRRTVSALADAESPVDLDELAAAVSARTPRSPLSDEPAPAPAITLHHVDLPKLEAAGIVDYDSGNGRVSYLGLPGALESAVTYD